MRIEFDLSPESIEKAARELREYAERLRNAESTISERLSEIAADTARDHYSEYVMVDTVPGGGVLACGDSVVFEEFGAGSRISDPYPDGADVDFEIRKGAFSDLHNGPYAQSGYSHWWYGGKWMRYITPRNALFYGLEEARSREAEVAREVLQDG